MDANKKLFRAKLKEAIKRAFTTTEFTQKETDEDCRSYSNCSQFMREVEAFAEGAFAKDPFKGEGDDRYRTMGIVELAGLLAAAMQRGVEIGYFLHECGGAIPFIEKYVPPDK